MNIGKVRRTITIEPIEEPRKDPGDSVSAREQAPRASAEPEPERPSVPQPAR